YSAPDTPAGLSRTANYYWGGLTYDATPFMHLQGAVYSMKIDAGQWTADHSGEGRSTIIGLGTMYDLSKRT
ncbi:porin, partial [Escherichia coli]